MIEQQVRQNSRIDPTGNIFLPYEWNPSSGATVPGTGVWRGYAIATAAGAVTIGNGVWTIALGTATAAGQSFPFTIGVAQGNAMTLTNCSIGGGIITES